MSLLAIFWLVLLFSKIFSHGLDIDLSSDIHSENISPCHFLSFFF